MACALTRRFSNSSFIRSIRSLYLSNLLSAGLPFFLTFTVRVSLSLSQFIFHLYSCLSLSLSLSLLGDFSLVFLSGLTQFFFFFFSSTIVYDGGVRISLERIDHASFQRDCG